MRKKDMLYPVLGLVFMLLLSGCSANTLAGTGGDLSKEKESCDGIQRAALRD